MTTTVTPAPRVIILICLMGILSQFATDSYTPSLPHIADYFHASHDSIKATVGVYFLGMGLSALVFGYLCDRFGRKSSLIGGYLLFLLASLLCSLAQTEWWLIAGRLLQGIAMGSSLVIFRAIMKDVFKRGQPLKKASLVISSIVSLTPPLAPISGGLIQTYLGWRMNFVLHAILVLSMLFLILKYLHLKPQGDSSSKPLEGYHYVFSQPRFLLNAACSGLALATVFIFITLAPFLFQTILHCTPTAYSLYLALMIVPPAIVIMLAARYARFNNMSRVMQVCASLTFLCSLLLALSYFLLGVSLPAIILIGTLLFTANTFQYTASYLCAYQHIQRFVGSASAIYGFSQVVVTALFALFASLFAGHSQLSLGLLMGIPPLGILAVKGWERLRFQA